MKTMYIVPVAQNHETQKNIVSLCRWSRVKSNVPPNIL